MAPISASRVNSLQYSFFFLLIALQSPAMKKLANNHFATRQSLGIRTSWGRLLFFCSFIAGGWSGFSAPWNFWLAANVHAASSALTPIVRRAEKVDLSPPLSSMQAAQAEAHVNGSVRPREVRLGRRPIARSAAAAMDTLVPAD